MVWPSSRAAPATGWQELWAEPLFFCLRAAPAAESHGFYRHRRQSMLGHPDGEIVLVAILIGPILTVIVNSNDVIHAASVPWNADHGSIGWLRIRGYQQVAEHSKPRPALNQEFLAPVCGKFA